MDKEYLPLEIQLLDDQDDPKRIEFVIKHTEQNTFWYKSKSKEEIFTLLGDIQNDLQSKEIIGLRENLIYCQHQDQLIKLQSFCDILNQIIKKQQEVPTHLKTRLQEFFQNEAISFDSLIRNQSRSESKKKKVHIQVEDIEEEKFNGLLPTKTNIEQVPKRSLTSTNLNQAKGILKRNSTIRRTTDASTKLDRRTNSAWDKGKQDENLSQYIKIKLNDQEDIRFENLQTPKAFETFLGTLLYTDLRLVGRGATTMTYKAKNYQNKIVAVKVLEKSEGGLQAALLFKSLNQDMANNLIGHTLFQHHIIEIGNILVIEEDLANETLEDILQQKAMIGEKISQDQLRDIILDITEQLYLLHICKGCVHNDIKPENILVKEKRYILHDLGGAEQVEKISSLLLPNQRTEIREVNGTLLYMSPAKLEHYYHCVDNELFTQPIDVFESHISNGKEHIPQMTFNKKLTKQSAIKFLHNPFKSDIYSFGLVLLRILLHNANITMTVQIENIYFHNREQLLQEAIIKHPFFFFEERLLIFMEEISNIRSLTELMLEANEDQRISTFDLALMLNSNQNILRSISTPLSQTFTPQITQFSNYTQVVYDFKKLIYEGSFDNEKLERNGQGVIYWPQDDYWNTNKLKSSTPIMDNKKHQTIQEEDEFALELSFIEGGSSILKSNLMTSGDRKHFLTKMKEQQNQPNEKIILYEGEWRRNLPNGLGTLNLYTTIHNNSYTCKSNRSNLRGKLINSIPQQQTQKLAFSINAEFFYGVLNGLVKITVIYTLLFQNKQQTVEKELTKVYRLNLSDSVLQPIKVNKLKFGRYTFNFENYTKNIMGYMETDDIYKEKSLYIIDVRSLYSGEQVNQLLVNLFRTLQMKVERILYNSDKINMIGVIELQCFQNNQEVLVIINFAETIVQKIIIDGELQQNKNKTTGCCSSLGQCFKTNKKIKISQSEQQKIRTNSQSVEGNLDMLSVVIDCVLTHLSLQVLDIINLPFGNLKHFALQKLEDLSQFTRLTCLNLEGCISIEARQVERILTSQTVTFLKLLNLSHLNITDLTISAIVSSEHLNQLSKLFLSACTLITLVSFRKLFTSSKMKRLTLLDISYLPCMDNTTINQLNVEFFSSLRELNLSFCHSITSEGLIKFFKNDLSHKLWIFKFDGISLMSSKRYNLVSQLLEVSI